MDDSYLCRELLVQFPSGLLGGSKKLAHESKQGKQPT
jgi:hypothetical protein